jgi:dinuclear metal center YbgI/SA1388 family protein
VDTVRDWLALVDAHWPTATASAWDAPGLHVGDPAREVARVLVALDVTPEVVEEAASVPGTLLLAHHPLLLRGLDRVTPSTPGGAMALRAAGAGIAIAAAHTNLDVARDGTGTSDPVADVLGLVDRRPLTTELRDGGRVKLVTFVPPSHTERVLDAVAVAGAGRIGAYERCSFRVRGTGTFTPGEASDPFSGTVGAPSSAEEDRLEVVVPRRAVGPVVAALLTAHPYDEVAYDLVPLVDGATVGFGIVGRLPTPRPLAEVAATLRAELPSPHLRVGGDRERVVELVATVGGSGGSLAVAAVAAGADVLVTGDMKHHDTLDLLAQGLAVIDAGHHATEVAAMPAWIDALRLDAADVGLRAPVLASTLDTDPWS